MIQLHGTIAFIDDDPDFIKLMLAKFKKVFSPDGLKVMVAYDGQAGINLVERTRPDLVILDVNMPDIKGTEVLYHIRTNPDPRISEAYVIMLTGHRDKQTIMKAISTGVNDYVVKPCKPAELIDRIQKYFLGE